MQNLVNRGRADRGVERDHRRVRGHHQPLRCAAGTRRDARSSTPSPRPAPIAFSGSAFYLLPRRLAERQRTSSPAGSEPYQNQQFGGTVGGPIVSAAQTHFFGSYERQDEPTTLSANTGFAVSRRARWTQRHQEPGFGRVDHSFTTNHRVSGKSQPLSIATSRSATSAAPSSSRPPPTSTSRRANQCRAELRVRRPARQPVQFNYPTATGSSTVHRAPATRPATGD